MQVVRTELPPLKYLDGCLKLPTAKGAIFAELLPTVAVRRVTGNTTLYSVVYRRPKKKAAEKKKSRVSNSLIVTVYQSDLRAKKFHVLVKMKVDVRMMSDDKSHRFGVAVAVDEVAACIYVAYTRDEAPVGKRPAPGTRLLLRRVHLTLAAADARGVRWLQRPDVTRRHPSQIVSKIFEARTYFGFGPEGTPLKVMANGLKAEEGIIVQQLAIDEGSLLLYSQWFTSASVEIVWAVALLKLNEKRASMDVRSLPSIGRVMIYGQGRRKYMARLVTGKSLREMRANEIVPKPYLPAPSLTKLGTVADAACRRLEHALLEHSAARQQVADRDAPGSIWLQTCACRRHQVFLSVPHGHVDSTGTGVKVLAVRGLPTVSPLQMIVSAQFADQPLLTEWQASQPKFRFRRMGSPVYYKFSGSWLLTLVTLQTSRQALSTKPVILRASLRSLLPPKTVCANCHVAIRPSQPDKKKMCSVCRMRGFTAYSWVFGCHFCSATCLRDAWPHHSRLHHTPPLKDWTDADWQQWRRDNSKQ